MKEEYNWWTDPKNIEEVKRLSWWNHPENQKVINFPIASITRKGSHEQHWTVCGSEETKKFLGRDLGNQVASSLISEEDAIQKYFSIIRVHYWYVRNLSLSYARWVPLKIGPWKHNAGKWFSVFGHNIYFRYGKNMKGGWYIPFTKLNISYYSEWITYRNWLKNNKEND